MSEAQTIAEWATGRPQQTRESYRIPCPVHGGKDHNAVVTDQGNRTLFVCHSHGCTFHDLVAVAPSHIWDSGSFIPRSETREKREPKPLTLRARETKYTHLGEEIWVSANEPLDEVRHHAYCRAKGFDYHYGARLGRMPQDLYPLRAGDSVLVLQMQDEQGIFTGVQVIAERKDDKGFIKRTLGSTGIMPLHANDPTQNKFIIVEGWATGVAASQLFPWAVPIVAFGSRIHDVAELWNRRFPDSLIFPAPDDADNVDLWDMKNDPALSDRLARKTAEIREAFNDGH